MGQTDTFPLYRFYTFAGQMLVSFIPGNTEVTENWPLLTWATNLPQISAVTKHAPVTSHSTGGFPDPRRTALVVCCLALGKGHKTKKTEPPARFPAAMLSAALQASGRRGSGAWVFWYNFRAHYIVPQEIKAHQAAAFDSFVPITSSLSPTT